MGVQNQECGQRRPKALNLLELELWVVVGADSGPLKEQFIPLPQAIFSVCLPGAVIASGNPQFQGMIRGQRTTYRNQFRSSLPVSDLGVEFRAKLAGGCFTQEPPLQPASLCVLAWVWFFFNGSDKNSFFSPKLLSWNLIIIAKIVEV